MDLDHNPVRLLGRRPMPPVSSSHFKIGTVSRFYVHVLSLLPVAVVALPAGSARLSVNSDCKSVPWCRNGCIVVADRVARLCHSVRWRRCIFRGSLGRHGMAAKSAGRARISSCHAQCRPNTSPVFRSTTACHVAPGIVQQATPSGSCIGYGVAVRPFCGFECCFGRLGSSPEKEVRRTPPHKSITQSAVSGTECDQESVRSGSGAGVVLSSHS